MDLGTMRLAGEAAAEMPGGLGLSPLDWRVVALARAEADRFGTRAFRARSRAGRLWDRLIGADGGVRRLADERLEALRRFAGLVRRGDREAASAAAVLASLGLAAPAIELVRAFAVR